MSARRRAILHLETRMEVCNSKKDRQTFGGFALSHASDLEFSLNGLAFSI